MYVHEAFVNKENHVNVESAFEVLKKALNTNLPKYEYVRDAPLREAVDTVNRDYDYHYYVEGVNGWTFNLVIFGD